MDTITTAAIAEADRLNATAREDYGRFESGEIAFSAEKIAARWRKAAAREAAPADPTPDPFLQFLFAEIVG